jgi:hypothetical protein
MLLKLNLNVASFHGLDECGQLNAVVEDLV